MNVMNPPLEQIKQNLPVCQYPRESYNRVAEILSHIRADRGVQISRIGKNGDHWIIALDQDWLYEFIMAYVNPLIDQTEAAAEYYADYNGGGGTTGYTGIKTVLTDVAWDETNHKWTKTTEAWTYTNGVLTSVAAATTSDIVTAVQEMP